MSNGDVNILKPTIPGEAEVPGQPAKVSEQKKEPEQKEASPRQDQFRDPLKDQTLRAQRMVQTPSELGKKYGQTLGQSVQDRQGLGQRGLLQGHEQPVEPQNYRQLLEEPAFRPMRESPLYQKMEQRSLNPRQGEPLTSQQMRRMIQMRNQVQDRSNMRQVVRFEIQQYRGQRLAQSSTPLPPEASGLSQAALFFQTPKQAAQLSNSSPESEFEKALKETAEGKKMVPDLPAGKSASYAAKSGSAWKTFFANALKLGSAETEVVKSQAELKEASFRGTYQEAANQKGLTLVSDLRFLSGERVVAEKFARILIENPELLALLQQLVPGDTIAADALKKMGEELMYLQLTHVVEGATAEEQQVARDAAFQHLRSPVNPQAQSRLEGALLRERSRQELEDQKKEGKSVGERKKGEGAWRWAGGDPRWEKQERPGRARSWTFFVYSVGTIAALMIGYVIFRLIF